MPTWQLLVDDFYEHMKKEQELLDLSYKESVRQKRERKKKEKKKKKNKWEWWEDFMPFYSQWYWTTNWLNEKCKAWYHGPRIKWMFLERWEKKQIAREKKRKKKK